MSTARSSATVADPVRLDPVRLDPAPLDAATLARIDALVAAHQALPGALLPLLHAVQGELGHLPAAALARIASGLNLSRAEVHGVVSFYPHFRSAPPAAHVLHLCHAEACQALGARALEAQARARLRPDAAGASADGSVTLLPVACLGLCACAPSALLDGEPHGRLDAATLDALLDACGAAR